MVTLDDVTVLTTRSKVLPSIWALPTIVPTGVTCPNWSIATILVWSSVAVIVDVVSVNVWGRAADVDNTEPLTRLPPLPPEPWSGPTMA